MSFKIQLVLKVIACPASLQYIECPWNAEPLDCPRVCTNRAFSEFHGMWVLFACLLFNQVLSKTDFPMHFTSANWKWKRFALKRRHLFISGEMLSFSGLPFLVSWKVKFYQNQTNSVLIFRVFHNLTRMMFLWKDAVFMYTFKELLFFPFSYILLPFCPSLKLSCRGFKIWSLILSLDI